uniref:NADH-ubiquinone oxidoreductase chain 2 n=1 Tax=Brachionus fernandoi TaxID=2498032 RepID=A0A8K1I862_9BILA|nr:NADH dehydrogenase subunit 2 [Brachionus fernandoi]
MLMVFSPYSFLFFSTYILFLFSLFSVNNFYFYWAIMELMMLLFMGLSYTLFVSSYSQLMIYFLIQTLSSFLILVFYVYSLPLLLTMAFFMKLSMFPFFMWYINLVYKFPNFVFWLASTLHKIPAMLMIKFFKLPAMLMIKLFSLPLHPPLLWLSILCSVLLSGLMMLSIMDLRMLLVLSSIGNNAWFLLSQMTNIFIFLLFIFFYSTSLFLSLNAFNSLSKPNISLSFSSSPYVLSLWVMSLSGMPPFPLFYSKMLIIFSLTQTLDLNYLFSMFLVFNSLMMMGYLQSLMKYFMYIYSSNVHYILKY